MPPVRATPEASLEATFRTESGRALATLIGLLGDFDLAEEAFQEACTLAAETWHRTGSPENPRSWLISTARHKALDRLRRDRTLAAKLVVIRHEIDAYAEPDAEPQLAGDEPWPDERLRLLFTCCHPALAPEAQVALTLKTICGLSTEEIARAFLAPTPTIAQRLVRAKAKIRSAAIPYRIPDASEMPTRLDAVLATIYLVFNEGYAATAGAELIRRDLCDEAIRLARLLAARLAERGEEIWRAEAEGLLALMLLHHSRRAARVDDRGTPILLDVQDRKQWDRAAIEIGLRLVERALRWGRPNPYAIEAAIAAVHARAERAEETDWRQIADLYGILARLRPSPVVELNRAVAIAMADGPEAGLARLDDLATSGALADYHLLPAARADLLRRLGRSEEAAAAYHEALTLARLKPEREFLARRLAEIEAG